MGISNENRLSWFAFAKGVPCSTCFFLSASFHFFIYFLVLAASCLVHFGWCMVGRLLACSSINTKYVNNVIHLIHIHIFSVNSELVHVFFSVFSEKGH